MLITAIAIAAVYVVLLVCMLVHQAYIGNLNHFLWRNGGRVLLIALAYPFGLIMLARRLHEVRRDDQRSEGR